MFNFISSLDSFKEKSRKIYKLFELNGSSTSVKDVSEIIKACEHPSLHHIIERKIKLFFESIALFDCNIPSLAQVYHHLSLEFNNMTYEKFKDIVFEKRLNAREFLAVPVEVGHSTLSKGEKIIHPYPKEFERFSILDPWKPVWLSANTSTRNKAFFAPALPMRCFGYKNLKLEQYQNWPTCKSHPYYETNKKLFTGNAGVIVRNKFNEIIGFMKWYWWNDQHVKGSDFHFCIQKRDEFIEVAFDLRPYEEKPSLGPDIEHKINSLNSSINENSFAITNIKNLGFRYKQVNGMWLHENDLL